MKILFVIPTYKPAYIYGGPIVVVSILAESLVKLGHEVTVYTTTGNGQSELEVEVGKEIVIDGVKVFYFKRLTKDHSHISPGFWNKIYRNVKNFDIVHLHSWWSPSIVLAAAICKFRGVKPILSPHGMFCDYVLYSKNKGKKRLLHLASKTILANTYLHVSTKMEWNESQALMGNNWEGTIIPNLVILSDKNSSGRISNKPFTIGFISRIDPKKGVDILIRALSKVNFEYKLKIAGSGEQKYISYLKDVAKDSGNADKIEWVGWKDNVQKFEFFSSIDLFALTSHNENFAVVVIEALSVGTPVFLSNNVGLSSYVEEKNMGWVTSIKDEEEVTTKLNELFTQKEKQEHIKNNSADVISKDYDIKYLTSQYAEYYSSILESRKN
jgi:glycosyltransferase involved in cell wall biosynthesis